MQRQPAQVAQQRALVEQQQVLVEHQVLVEQQPALVEEMLALVEIQVHRLKEQQLQDPIIQDPRILIQKRLSTMLKKIAKKMVPKKEERAY